MATPPDPAILVRLGYEPADLKKGLLQARSDVAKYKAEATLLETELKRERARLAVEFSTENRREIQKRITDLQRELSAATGAIAGKRGAERQAALDTRREVAQQLSDARNIVASYQQQKSRVQELSAAQLEAASKAKQAQAAAGVFRETGRITGEIPGLSDLLANLSPGLASIQSRLGGILNSLVILGGGVKGGLGGLAEGAAEARGEVAALGGGMTLLGARAASLINPITGLATLITAVAFGSTKAGLAVGEWADKLTEFGQITGLSAQQLQGLEFVGRATRLSIDEMVTSMRQLAKAVEDGNPRFAELHIATRNIADGSARDLFEVLLDVGDAIKNARTEAERLTIATDLLGGRTGTRLIPTFLLGRDALKALFDEAKERGVRDIKGLAEQFDQLELANARVEASWRRMQEVIGDVTFWTAIKETYADILNVLNNAGLPKIPPPRTIRTIPHATGGVDISQFAPPNIDLSGLPQITIIQAELKDSPKVAAARAELAAAHRKELTAAEQLAKVQADLNRLQVEEARLKKERASGINIDDALITNLKSQAGIWTQILQLQKALRNEAETAAEKWEKIIEGPLSKPRKPEFTGPQGQPLTLLTGQAGPVQAPIFKFDPQTKIALDILSGHKAPIVPSQTAAFFQGLKDFSDVVGKFDAGLNKNLVKMFALIDGFQVVIKQMQALSGQKGIEGFVGGIKALFSGKDNQGNSVGIGERLSGALGLAGIAGSLIGGIVGFFKGRARAETARLARQLGDDLNTGIESFNRSFGNTTGITNQLGAITAEQARLAAQWNATLRQLQGRTGGVEEVNRLAPGIKQQFEQMQSQFEQLMKTQKQLFQGMTQERAFLITAEGARDASKAIADLAIHVNEFISAGGSAAEATDYLNRSLGELATSLGRGLRDAERGTIDLLLQEIDLQKQREEIIADAADAEAAARRSGGLERALTPGQQAALDIQAIRKQRDEQLAQLDEEKAHLDAQIGAQAQLFGLTGDRNALLATQLDLEREITAETVARLAEQKKIFDQLMANHVPDITWGLIPGGGGGAGVGAGIFNIAGVTINIELPVGSAFTPEDAARIVRDGLVQIGQQQQVGF